MPSRRRSVAIPSLKRVRRSLIVQRMRMMRSKTKASASVSSISLRLVTTQKRAYCS
jgi:hypothetical protein